MKNLIKNIISSEDIGDIVSFVLDRIYRNGPVSTTDMEILSYLKLYKPEEFKIHQQCALNYMGVFYKDTPPQTLKEVVFRQYRKHILEKFQHTYTPVQANIINEIELNKCFSFSAPTSTGKSYVFLNLIQESLNDIVIVVPSRALINEYYFKLNNEFKLFKILRYFRKNNFFLNR